ncbi:hypothetical protein HN569_00600 [bacterium]|jgi:hypothetical protein|nr:hypothetical protein [archaeon]MBT7992332.1 hypothetical protein [bacterium]
MSRYKLSQRKLTFARYYFDFEKIYSKSSYFNAYRCALAANYSDSYAKKIMSFMNWQELEMLLKMSESL